MKDIIIVVIVVVIVVLIIILFLVTQTMFASIKTIIVVMSLSFLWSYKPRFNALILVVSKSSSLSSTSLGSK